MTIKKVQIPQNSFSESDISGKFAPKYKKHSDSFLFESGILLNLCNHQLRGFILFQKSLKIHKLTSSAATPSRPSSCSPSSNAPLM